MNRRVFDTSDDLINAAARTIQQRVEQGARSIALSGGSTPQPLYRKLGETPYLEFLAEYPITWIVVDERYVPFDDPQSNAGMIGRTLFAHGIPAAHRFLPFNTALSDPQASVAAFETSWREAGLSAIDIVLLGMGDDGHTASLFPGTAVLEIEDGVAAAVYVPKLSMWRVTLTKNVLQEAELRLVLATGAAKAPILAALESGADYPIGQVTSGDRETWWFLDRAAAGSD